MSTLSYRAEWRRGIGRFAFSILGGLVLALQLVLPPVAFAASNHAGNSADPPQAQAQAEVSVVRLVFDYTTTTPSTGTPVLCTSLGVLVKSWQASKLTDLNSLVLTDGSLLDTTSPACAPASSPGKPATTYTLSTVSVYTSNLYTANTPAIALLGTYSPVPTNHYVCSPSPCSSGVALFAIHTDYPQPTLDVATTNTTAQFGLELTDSTSTIPHLSQSLASVTAAQQFLTPTAVKPDVTNTQDEVGMPIINSDGQLVGMRLQGTTQVPSAQYSAFIAQQATFFHALSNPLQVDWQNGMKDYYTHDPTGAVTAFKLVEALNPNLKAAVTFEKMAEAQLNTTQSSQQANPNPPPEDITFLGIPRSTLVYIAIGAGVLLLIVLLIMVTLTNGNPLTRLKQELARIKFKMEQTETQRKAERDLQQMQRTKAITNLQPPVTNLPCPNCGTLVQTNANSCPNCRFLLSASASGLHLRATPPPTAAPRPQQLQPQADYIQPPGERKETTVNPQSPTDMLCPNCGHAVRASATYCPNCRYLLSPLAKGAPPTLNMSTASELAIIDKAQAPSTTTSQPQQAPVKETVLDDLAIQAALQGLWDKAGR